MRADPVPELSPDKTPHERLMEFDKKVTVLPKTAVDKQEADWHARKRVKQGRKKR